MIGVFTATFFYSLIMTPQSELTPEIALDGAKKLTTLFLLIFFLILVPQYFSENIKAPELYNKTFQDLSESNAIRNIIWIGLVALGLYFISQVNHAEGFNYCQ
ncbi:hypothetical protein [Halomonas sp. RA08-2]|uniref:hypothetical protein n=1 Tax=Halomonas sp. RA08-2 TaxID=3440842 RepID=UPI003F494814